MKLTTIQMQEMKGGALTPQLVLVYLMLAAPTFDAPPTPEL